MNSIVVTPTNKLSDSLSFYIKLGFSHFEIDNRHWISDGKILLEIDEERTARAGVKLYKEDWKDEVLQLEAITAVKEIENGFLLNDSSGVRIELITGQNIVDIELSDLGPSTLGNYAGLSLEGIEISAMYPIWKILGFEITMGGPDQSWMVAANKDALGISFMSAGTCPHLFFNPSMTFFNGKENIKIIERIRQAEIPISEEITHFNSEGLVDNVVLRDPGGFGFFIFSD